MALEPNSTARAGPFLARTLLASRGFPPHTLTLRGPGARQVFRKIDLDHDGRLSFSEFCAGLKKHQPFLAEAERQANMSTVDSIAQGPGRSPSKEDLVYNRWKQFNSALHTLDGQGTGFLHKEVMRTLLKMFGLFHGSCGYVLSRCDHHGQGKICYEEFAKNLKKADYPMMNTPDTKAPGGATTRHQAALESLTARKERNKMVTREQRVAEAKISSSSPPQRPT